ncbi:MAG: hypothetical protein WC700_16720 [Gemmatimonadaceae bacterium]
MHTTSKALMRRVGLAAVLGLLLTGCSDILTVSNPKALQEEQLNNPALEQFIVNGSVGEFQYAYGFYSMWSGVLADELYTDHTTVGIRELSLHNFLDSNGPNESVFEFASRARTSSDDAVMRLKQMLGASAGSSLNIAKALAYGGYSYVLLGEGFCEAPVALGPGLTSNELLKRAVQHFDSAVTIAQAFAAVAGQSAANIAAANDIINLSRVGAARASLKSGDNAKARAYAVLVPETYEKLSYYSSNSVRENNYVNSGLRNPGGWLSMAPPFANMNDPRIPQDPAKRTGLNSNTLYMPLRPLQYVGWVASGSAPIIDITTSVKMASGFEAKYMILEVDGPNAAMLTFVNERRAVGGKPPVNLTGAELLAEFRMQRGIDLYLTGQRLGDLRRYKTAGVDLFPKGKYPIFVDNYGTNTCFLVPLNEKSGNPNYK